MACHGWHRLPIMLVLLIVAGSLSGKAIETLYKPLNTLCPAEGGNFSAGSMYQANIDGLTHSLSRGAATNGGFLNISFGDPRDEAFGVIWCFFDISWADCLKCLDRAPSYVSTACPNGWTGALLYKECALKYSDEAFAYIQTDSDQAYEEYLTEYVDDVVSTNHSRWNMMSQLIEEAAMSPKGFANANGSKPYNGSTSVYGLVQCRRDLTPVDCTKCLDYNVEYLLKKYPNNTSANIRGFGCFVIYHPEPGADPAVGRDAMRAPPNPS